MNICATFCSRVMALDIRLLSVACAATGFADSGKRLAITTMTMFFNVLIVKIRSVESS